MLLDDESQHTIDSSADECTVPMKGSAVQEFDTKNKGSSDDNSNDTQASKNKRKRKTAAARETKFGAIATAV